MSHLTRTRAMIWLGTATSLLCVVLLATVLTGCGLGQEATKATPDEVADSLRHSWDLDTDVLATKIVCADDTDTRLRCRVFFTLDTLDTSRLMIVTRTSDRCWRATSDPKDGSRPIHLKGCAP